MAELSWLAYQWLMVGHRVVERLWWSVRSIPAAWSLPILAVILSLAAPLAIVLAKDATQGAPITWFVFVFLAAVVGSLGRWLGASYDRVRLLAMTDPLTGLFNRRMFGLRLEAEVGVGRPLRRNACVMCLDIDRLKSINDAFGHGAGDRALLAVSEILRSSVRASDTVARLGGDEFGVLLPDATAIQALAITKRILRQTSGKDPSITRQTVSIGIAEIPAGSTALAADLLDAADAALYRAKVAGGGGAALARIEPRASSSPGKFRADWRLLVEDLVDPAAAQ